MSPGSNNLALDVGQVFLMGDLSDDFQDNIGVQLHYTYGVSDLFGFDASAGFSTHANGGNSGKDLFMGSALAGLRTNLAWYDRVVPYAVFGLGFYKPSFPVADGSSLSPILFGLHLGPGVDLQLTDRLFFGASLTFHDMFSTTRALASGGTKELGGTFTSFYLHAGASF